MRLRRALAVILGIAIAAGAWLLTRRPPASSGSGAPVSPAAAENLPKLPHGLTAERLKALGERLLRAAGEPAFSSPPRNIFRTAGTAPKEAPGVASLEPVAEATAASRADDSTPDISLVGFLERSGPEGAGKCLAVFRLEGEVLVVGEGEDVGAYVVEKIVNGEEVRLRERARGTPRVFRIE